MRITSIDFETANHSRASICAAGLATFEDGSLVESLYWLVRPPKGHGWFREDFTECHGLTWFDVQDAPEFPDIAPVLLERLTRSDVVVAHNAQFDIGALQTTLNHFRPPFAQYLTTYAHVAWPGTSGRTCRTTSSARSPPTSATSFTITTLNPTPKPPDECCWL